MAANEKKKNQKQETSASSQKQLRDIMDANIVKPGSSPSPNAPTPAWWAGKWDIGTYNRVQANNRAQQSKAAKSNPKLSNFINNTVSSINSTSSKKAAQNEARLDDILGSVRSTASTVDAAKKSADDAQRNLKNYENSPAVKQRENRARVPYAQQREQGDMATAKPDETLIRLQQEAEMAQRNYESAQAAENDRNIYNQDMADINAMSDEQLANLANYAAVREQGRTGNPITDLIYLPAKKKKAAGDLLDTYGEKRLNELAETYSRSNAEREKEQVQEAAKKASTGVVGGTLTTIGGIAASPVSGWMGVKGRLDELGNSTGRYQSLSPYTMGDALNVYTDTAKQNVTQQIAGDGSNVLRQGAALLYQAGVGAAESASKAIVLGPQVAAATSAMSAYSRTLADASEKGATAEQAVLLATSNAALDYVMDRIPMEKLFSLAQSGSTSALKAAFKQAGIEMTTEGASFLGSQLLEMGILQQSSEYAQSVQNYIALGYAPEDAQHQAAKDLALQAGQQILVAGISGGVSAGVSTAVGNRRQKAADALLQEEPAAAQQEPTPQEQPVQQPVEPQQATPQEAETAAAQEAARAEEPARPIDTVSRMAEDIGRGATQRQQEAQSNMQSVTDQVAAMTGGGAEAQQAGDTVGKQSSPSEDTKKSATFNNSGLNSSDEDIRAGYKETLNQEPAAGDYQVKHNADVYSVAQERTSTPEKVSAEYDYIMNKTAPLTAEDGVTGRLVAKQLFKDGDTKRLVQLNKRLAQEATNAGQFNQAFSITGKMRDVSDPLSAADSATARISSMEQKDSTYPGKKCGLTYEAWQDSISEKISGLARDVDSIESGDVASMKALITKLAKERNTTAFFGVSNRLTKTANSILDKMEFDDLKKIADTQIASMPDDYRKRGKLELANGLRKQSMLSSLKTFERNLAGNGAVGLLDSASDSFGGRLADIVLSKATGKRTIGNDLARGGTYIKSAADAGKFAALCVELNVPIETEVNASFDAAVGANSSGKFIGKTFTSASSNPIMRGLYAYQKYMSYALEVSDKIFEGGTSGATEESLRRLKDSGLSDEEISRLSDYTANRRTFKDATWQDEKGRTRGSDLSRLTQKFKNLPNGIGGPIETVGNAVMDSAIPFASVPANVAQTGTDYTIGVLKGLTEMAKIAYDSKHGVSIPVERQRQAASDFGRGLTGAGLISLAAAAAAKGILQVHDDSDKNKKALDQSQGLSGAQFNWTAAGRAAEGGSEKWQSGDLVTSLDFLEPFNTHMYLGAELANAESGIDYAKAPFVSILSSFMDSPMNSGLNQINELFQDVVSKAETGDTKSVGDALAEYGGNYASTFIPQFVRQAAQTKDGYYRDTRGSSSGEYALNSIKNAIPGASETLPKKVDGFGKEQERPGAISNFLDPTNTKRLELNDDAAYLDELSGRTGDKSIYPARQAPLTVKNAVGDEVRLTNAERETYQRTYGGKVSDYYERLQQSEDFSSLRDDLKTDALNKAKEYAAQYARASVTDFKGTPKGNSSEVIENIIGSVVAGKAESTLQDISDAWENGYDVSKNAASIDSIYKEMQKLSSEAQERIVEETTGQAKKYLEARTQGFSSDAALSVIKQVQSISEDHRNTRGYQLEAVARTPGLRESDMDKAMKLYLPEYNPDDKQPDVSRLRYDYIRKELGYSPKDYAAFQKAHSVADSEFGNDNGGVSKAELRAAFEAYGYDQKTADQIYTVLWGGSSKAGKAVKSKILEIYG